MPRSGTHLAEQWLVPHVQTLKVDSANRHKLIDDRAGLADGLILCIKHPMSWMVSMHRYALRTFDVNESKGHIDHLPVNLAVDFSIFCQENLHLIQAWNTLNNHWMNQAPGDWFGCNYEVVIRNPEEIVRTFGKWVGIIPRSARRLPTTRMTIEEEFNPQYYLHEFWRGQYVEDSWGALAQFVDPGLVTKFGFDMEWR